MNIKVVPMDGTFREITVRTNDPWKYVRMVNVVVGYVRVEWTY